MVANTLNSNVYSVQQQNKCIQFNNLAVLKALTHLVNTNIFILNLSQL